MVFKNNLANWNLTSEIQSRAAEVAFLVLNEIFSVPRVTIQVRWICHLINWFKLNSDGSSLGNPSIAGRGGLIQNDRGDWVKSYARFVGITTSVAVKLWALRDGVNLCLSLNLQVVEVELDTKLVVDLFRKDCGNVNGNNTIVVDFKESLQQIPWIRVKHRYYEANKCADALARWGALLAHDFTVYMEPPLILTFCLD